VGRAVMAWLAPVEGLTAASSACRRIAVAPGVEVLIDEQHPALRLNRDTAVIAEALRQALSSVVGLEASASGDERRSPPQPTWSSVEPEPETAEESQMSSEPS
jgi:hypothetical protein